MNLPTQQYDLRHVDQDTGNTIVVFTGTHSDCFHKLHKVQPNSADHALKYEGWSVEPVKKTYDQMKKEFGGMIDEVSHELHGKEFDELSIQQKRDIEVGLAQAWINYVASKIAL